MNLKNNHGNAFTIAIFFIAVAISIFIFMAIIYVGEMNSLAYNIKLDMYSINRSAIIAVNKGITSRSTFSYNSKAYKQYFEDALKKNYKLNDNLKSEDGIIKEIEIKEYEIYKNNEKDSVTNENSNGNTIHSVLKVTIRPIFNNDILAQACTFYIHEDVALNELKTR